eukprot:CAMPEP_0113279968 /NCGR_PEP_ID=MMETSP0008_2-20120614/27479_1 /TAXON_ID=97485 /ORGANISM="Prymnesium parvum" /LENGTH=288 /DNA_ID=CAMNT_0000130211 /DNA_START=403 /DNA_END=1270 /DNA_ORIENTATION=- /assembly_acc=CAM_ASM_000153
MASVISNTEEESSHSSTFAIRLPRKSTMFIDAPSLHPGTVSARTISSREDEAHTARRWTKAHARPPAREARGTIEFCVAYIPLGSTWAPSRPASQGRDAGARSEADGRRVPISVRGQVPEGLGGGRPVVVVPVREALRESARRDRVHVGAVLRRRLEALRAHQRAELVEQVGTPDPIAREAAALRDAVELLGVRGELARVVLTQPRQRGAAVRALREREDLAHLGGAKPPGDPRAREASVLQAGVERRGGVDMEQGGGGRLRRVQILVERRGGVRHAKRWPGAAQREP